MVYYIYIKDKEMEKMNKRNFFNNLVTNLREADASIRCHTNTDAYNNPIMVTASKPFNPELSTHSENVISVKCDRNVVSVLVDGVLVDKVDWKKHYTPNMVALTVERVRYFIK